MLYMEGILRIEWFSAVRVENPHIGTVCSGNDGPGVGHHFFETPHSLLSAHSDC